MKLFHVAHPPPDPAREQRIEQREARNEARRERKALHHHFRKTGGETLPGAVLSGVHGLDVPLFEPAPVPSDAVGLFVSAVPEVDFEVATGTPFDEKPINKHRYAAHNIHELRGMIALTFRWLFK